MKDKNEFLKYLKTSSKDDLIYLLNLEREILSEIDESDPTFNLFKERIHLYQVELENRTYFEGINNIESNDLKVIEITIGTYCTMLKNKIELNQNSGTGLIWDIIESFKAADINENILCAVKGSEIIIDIKTLMSEDSRFSFERLSSINGYKPEYNHISELPHLFWLYVLQESNAIHLYKEIGTALLNFFNCSKIIDSIRAGTFYNKWEESDSLARNLQYIESEKKYPEISIEIQLYNHTDEITKWYCFDLGKRGINLTLGETNFNAYVNSSFAYDLFNDYNHILENEILGKNYRDLAKSFIHAFTYPLANTDYNIDMTKDFIHVFKFKFEVEDCKPRYEFSKY